MTSNILKTIGARNDALEDRQINDFYATEPKAVELLLEKECFSKKILEPACGMGHISNVLKHHGYDVYSYDIINRGYGKTEDFFDRQYFDGDIITNPPYKIALPFLEHALNVINTGNKVALFLRILFLEGKARGKFFKNNPPKKIYIASGRLNCAKNGDFEKYKKSTAQAYAWFVWEKGFCGATSLDWINI